MELTDLILVSNQTFTMTGKMISKSITETTRQSLVANSGVDITGITFNGKVQLDLDTPASDVNILGSISNASAGIYSLRIDDEDRDTIFNFDQDKNAYSYFVDVILPNATSFTLLQGSLFLRRIS